MGWINLGSMQEAAKEEKAVYARFVRGFNDVALYDEVVADEVGGVCVVGEDATHLRPE
jgi:hypothetical protein